MRQKSWIAALLLPLPFAALPLIAVAYSHFQGPSGSSHVVLNSAPVELHIGDGPVLAPAHRSLAYGIAAPSADGCLGDTASPTEG
jgi:hypothetical protein